MGDQSAVVYECESCQTTLVASGEPDTLQCCGEAMTRLDSDPQDELVNEPDIETLWKDVFGLSETTILICICVMMDEPTTIDEIAEMVDVSESTVSNHLQPLVDAGILSKSVRNLRDGGTVNVYTGAPVEIQQAIYRRGLYTWVAAAIDLIDEYSLDDLKEPYLSVAESEAARAQRDVFWE